MLVSMGQGVTISENTSETYTYSPNSVQKVLIRLDDTDWEQANITVQIGSVTICNGISTWGLAGYTGLFSNVDKNTAGQNVVLDLDFGSHQCTDRDNLYVTIQNGASELTLVDVSAIINEPGDLPLRLTEYSDNTFVSPSNLVALSYDSSQQEVEDDNYRCEIRTPISASSPSFVSASSYYDTSSFSQDNFRDYGLLRKCNVPMDTSFNYPTAAVTDRILTVEQMPSTQQARQQSQTNEQIAQSQRSV
tara:strand:+ start:1738 stop:2481 length:744 start_codon:yes stop_codon:yes gene_type:complete